MPARETRQYVQRVMASYWIYQQRLGEPTTSLDAVASGRWPTYAKLDNAMSKAATGTLRWKTVPSPLAPPFMVVP